MLQEYNLLINGITLLISLSGLICEAQSPIKNRMSATISEYGEHYVSKIHNNYKLLIMALGPDMNFTKEECGIMLRESEKEHQVKWALNYLNAAKETWKLESERFNSIMNNYTDLNKSIVPDFCMTMLQQSSARNWNATIQSNIAYGCGVLKKYSQLKWEARTQFDKLAIRWLDGWFRNGQSQYVEDRGFDYRLRKENVECAERVMMIHRTKAEIECMSTAEQYLESQGVKDTTNSRNLIEKFDNIYKNFNISLVELKSIVQDLENRRLDYLRFVSPIERVINVLSAMDAEVDHQYGVYN
ncbi:unnamed protein product [Schistosoma haematobium]|nr:unnamed protein product [Schistosoma haematobium]CAH8556653.1 unnamed protein product [Schistosoma haematobium]